jgi:hypothetical protein
MREFRHGTVCDSSEAVKHYVTRQRRLHPESDAGRLVIGIRRALSGGADDRLFGRELSCASQGHTCRRLDRVEVFGAQIHPGLQIIEAET